MNEVHVEAMDPATGEKLGGWTTTEEGQHIPDSEREVYGLSPQGEDPEEVMDLSNYMMISFATDPHGSMEDAIAVSCLLCDRVELSDGQMAAQIVAIQPQPVILSILMTDLYAHHQEHHAGG